MKTIRLSDDLAGRFDSYLKRDPFTNALPLSDLHEAQRRSRSEFYVAKGKEGIVGYLLVYKGEEYPIVWLRGSKNVGRELLKFTQPEKTLFHVDQEISEIVEEMPYRR